MFGAAIPVRTYNVRNLELRNSLFLNSRFRSLYVRTGIAAPNNNYKNTIWAVFRLSPFLFLFCTFFTVQNCTHATGPREAAYFYVLSVYDYFLIEKKKNHVNKKMKQATKQYHKPNCVRLLRRNMGLLLAPSHGDGMS